MLSPLSPACARLAVGSHPASLPRVALKLRDKYWNHLVAPDVPMREKGSRIQILLAELGVRKPD
jgi:hypothetical protein